MWYGFGIYYTAALMINDKYTDKRYTYRIFMILIPILISHWICIYFDNSMDDKTILDSLKANAKGV